MTVRDALLNASPESTDLPLIGTSVLSADTLDIEGAPIAGLAMRVDVAHNHGSTIAGTFTVYVRAASSTPVSSSDPIVGQSEDYVESEDGNFQLIVPFVTNKRYVRCEFAPGHAASDSPSFSVVEAYVVHNVGWVWDRNTNFH